MYMPIDMPKYAISNVMVHKAAYFLARRLLWHPTLWSLVREGRKIKIWGVPRGGVSVAYALMAYGAGAGGRFQIVDSVEDCDIIVDDLVDTGRTLERYRVLGKPFGVLFDKHKELDLGLTKNWIVGWSLPSNVGWLVFPWEVGEED